MWNSDIILHGRVATASDSKSARELMQRFRSAIRKNLTRIKAFWVGPAARVHLECGKRLTISVQSPHEFDLKIP
jgi:hypothetical protein